MCVYECSFSHVCPELVSDGGVPLPWFKGGGDGLVDNFSGVSFVTRGLGRASFPSGCCRLEPLSAHQ